jgi:hypothetical protein
MSKEQRKKNVSDWERTILDLAADVLMSPERYERHRNIERLLSQLRKRAKQLGEPSEDILRAIQDTISLWLIDFWKAEKHCGDYHHIDFIESKIARREANDDDDDFPLLD